MESTSLPEGASSALAENDRYDSISSEEPAKQIKESLRYTNVTATANCNLFSLKKSPDNPEMQGKSRLFS